jgi:hypothetical protein
MPSLFTHTFEVELKADGSQFLKGEIEFNVDGEVSFDLQDSSIPLSKDAMHEFVKLADHLQSMFYEFEGIKRIEIVQKPAP